jgi:hypothetical protein
MLTKTDVELEHWTDRADISHAWAQSAFSQSRNHLARWSGEISALPDQTIHES